MLYKFILDSLGKLLQFKMQQHKGKVSEVENSIKIVHFLTLSKFRKGSVKCLNFYCAACKATHGIAVAILSICLSLSVCLSDVCIVTKLNDALQMF